MSQDDPRPLVLLVEDEALERIALAGMLERGGFRVMPVVSAEEALQVLGAVPDIEAVVTDVNLSSGAMDGFELARRVRQEWGLGVLVMSGRGGPEADDLPPGVGFLAKPIHRATFVHLVRDLTGRAGSSAPPQITSTPPDVDPDSPKLTPRQYEVLEMLVQGKSNRDIAEALGLSENTIKVHLAAIFRTLGVSSRTEALLAGMKALQRSS